MHNNDIGGWVQSLTNWASSNIFHTYVKLKAGVDPKAFEQKLQPFIERRGGADIKPWPCTEIIYATLEDI